MKNKDFETLDDLLTELGKDYEYQKEYNRQKPYYDILLEVIKRRKQLKLTQEQKDQIGRT